MLNNENENVKQRLSLKVREEFGELAWKKAALENVDYHFPVAKIENGYYLHNLLFSDVEKILIALDSERKKQEDLFKKEHAEKLKIQAEKERVEEELRELKKRYKKFEDNQKKGTGRPKVVDEKTLKIAYDYLVKNAKEVEGRRTVNYRKTFKHMQEEHGYKGSYVSLTDELRLHHEKVRVEGKNANNVDLVGLAVQDIMKTKMRQSKMKEAKQKQADKTNKEEK